MKQQHRETETWFIDGFNVLQGNFSYPAQKTLVQLCCQLLGVERHLTMTIVFDDVAKRLYNKRNFTVMEGRLHVLYARSVTGRSGEGAADDTIVTSIEALAQAGVPPHLISVFTSDRGLSLRLLDAGLAATNILDHASFQGRLIKSIFPDFLELHCSNRYIRTFQG